ncbi:hypothetical protein [Coleofasciculus sp. G2-EDA-02]|uniref:hypothetical protein n=1 Tax=Coleofasciculus sp. G2-EDA-02 TaxID=3069529 RepID=UPI0032F13B50
MRRFRLVLVALLTFGLVTGASFLKKAFSVTLCSLLFFNSTACYRWSDPGRVSAAIPTIEEAAPPETPQEIAIPPIIRQAPIDLQDSLAEDFVISRQTPYRSGRNEILVTSPSTGTEQRYQINLPGTGDFQLYEAAFSNVSINNPSQVVEGGTSQLSAAQIQAKLKSFKITFNNDNLPAEVVLADGTKAEFTNTEAVIRSPNGQVVETVPISSAGFPTDRNIAAKSYAKVGEADSLLLAQSNQSGCQGNIRNKLARLADDMTGKGETIKAAANSDEAMLMTWVLTFGARAMKESISDRNVKLEEVACQPPVQCNQPQMYEGGSEIRTDLFQLPVGTNRQVSLEYQFYQIPDRLELSYEGEIIFDVGPASGRSTQTISSLPDGAGYVGIRLIGNDNSNTKWWYTISCAGEKPQELGIDRWWATAGDSEPMIVNWTVEIPQNAEGEYQLEVHVTGRNSWNLTDGSTVTVDQGAPILLGGWKEWLGSVDIGNLKPGYHIIKIDGFKVPDEPTIEEVRFKLDGNAEPHPELTALFIADREPYKGSDAKTLAEKYAPILYFDKGEIGENKPEGYPTSSSINETWGRTENKPSPKGDSTQSIDLSSYGDSPTYCATQINEIYALVSSDDSGNIAINYYFHYPRSNWKYYDGFNTHQGDWEGVTVFINGNEEKVAFSQHVSTSGSYGGMIVPLDLLDRPKSDEKKFNVYVGLGGHASYPFQGITGWRYPYIAGSANREFHKGDLKVCGSGISANVEVLSHVGRFSSTPDSQDYQKYAWLLFPGLWGNDGSAPRGPLFLDSNTYDFDIRKDEGLGVRWFNPWGWAQRYLKELTPGINDWSTIDQFIVLGNEGNNTLIADEKRSILRGGDGNDIYKLEDGLGEDINGSFIEDTGGDNDSLILEDYDSPIRAPVNHIISLSGLVKNQIGLYRDGTALIIDISQDGQVRYAEDLTLLDFFDDSSDANPGKGFIETVGNLRGSDILSFFRNN